jgi:hypothetical protein
LGNGVFLAVERARDPVTAKVDARSGWHMVAIAITPAEREPLAKKLAAAGYPMVRETGFTFYVHDPDGALVGFSHYPEPQNSV